MKDLEVETEAEVEAPSLTLRLLTRRNMERDENRLSTQTSP